MVLVQEVVEVQQEQLTKVLQVVVLTHLVDKSLVVEVEELLLLVQMVHHLVVVMVEMV